MSYHIVVCLSQTPSHSSFPDHMHIYLFNHLVYLFLISFCPFSLLPQHLQLETCHGHPIPNLLSCSSLNLDSWSHICFMLGFTFVLVQHTYETHWYPGNPGHFMDPNLESSPHPVPYPSGWAVLLTSCCSIASSFFQGPSWTQDIHSSRYTAAPPSPHAQAQGVPTSCLLVTWARWLSPTKLTGASSCHKLRSVLEMSHTTV